eukprot:TRINITY_DN3679_c0_g1_i2.p2 TRINITY_DN3679_c0_g1~~TRINITY_DN3679_c0_g1_i2.p2  ORF type:complete len:186 (-),score=52.94 TRINITY_DN3679_c0_g1_i2:412-969(-)
MKLDDLKNEFAKIVSIFERYIPQDKDVVERGGEEEDDFEWLEGNGAIEQSRNSNICRSGISGDIGGVDNSVDRTNRALNCGSLGTVGDRERDSRNARTVEGINERVENNGTNLGVDGRVENAIGVAGTDGSDDVRGLGNESTGRVVDGRELSNASGRKVKRGSSTVCGKKNNGRGKAVVVAEVLI